MVHVLFSDRTEGDIDMRQEIYGEMFALLKDRGTFKQFTIHPEFHTLCCPNEVDIAPEYLYEKVKVPA